jgi:3'-phosphoadenosine 5'-phosphosulfate (PAPS) 3'-phosphatase
VKTWYRFIRGDQYAVALGLLDEGKVVLGVLACNSAYVVLT